MKRKTVAQLKKKLWPIFSEYIRLRDCLRTTGSLEYGECFTCDRPSLPISKLQAGHFIPGHHNATLFSEQGCHAQCAQCNVYEHGRQWEYGKRLDELYGVGTAERLKQESDEIKKLSTEELEGMIEDYKSRVEKLRGGIR
jgi:hypothetical protein